LTMVRRVQRQSQGLTFDHGERVLVWVAGLDCGQDGGPLGVDLLQKHIHLFRQYRLACLQLTRVVIEKLQLWWSLELLKVTLKHMPLAISTNHDTPVTLYNHRLIHLHNMHYILFVIMPSSLTSHTITKNYIQQLERHLRSCANVWSCEFT